jgi:hypothetical protein
MEQLRSNYENLSSDSTSDLTYKLNEKQTTATKPASRGLFCLSVCLSVTSLI